MRTEFAVLPPTDPIAVERSSRAWLVGLVTCVVLVACAVLAVYYPLAVVGVFGGFVVWGLWTLAQSGRAEQHAAAVIAVLGVLLLAGTGTHSMIQSHRIEVQRARLDTVLRATLRPGNDRPAIERTLRAERLRFLYSKTLHAYSASVPTAEADTRIEVLVQLDPAEHFSGVSVQRVTTTL